MLIKLVCPQCGGKMDIDDSREKAFCLFCGTELINFSQKVDITQNINVSGTVIHKMDRSEDANLYIEFSSSDPRALMVISFDKTKVKKVIHNGQTGTMKLPLGTYIATMDLAGKRYRREITIVDYAPVRINASSFGRREIVIDQPQASTGQKMQEQAAKPEQTARGPKPSGYSIAGFIFSLTLYFSIVGIILAAIDLVKVKDKPHGLSVAAIIIGAVFTLFLVILLIGSGIESLSSLK